MILPKDKICIFTDGASSGNPGPSGWGSILRWPDGRICELGGGESRATNNRMELLAALKGIEQARQEDARTPILILTDSTYVIKGMTEWARSWEKRGWPEDLANRELWKQLWALRASVEWKHVRGHSGIPGNERADAIAVAFSKKTSVKLYEGSGEGYAIKLEGAPDLRPAVKAKNDGALYLSLVDGVLERHEDWASCEARVKGRSGARFQKATSFAEEAEILAKWGISG